MRFPFHRIATARNGLMAIAVVALGACSATDGPSLVSGAAPATPDATTTAAVPTQFLKSSYCPPIQIRAGTEAMTIYERGHDNESAFVRQQASITKTARECRVAGNELAIKIGVSGRVVAGPKGGAGSVTLPVRVAVAKQIGGAGPLYTNLFKVPVTLSAPTFGKTYQEVFNVSVPVGPQDRDLIIFVGFDEGKK
ncbi:hypothetical protein [Bauldia litoralis]|uniref:hypothetical protein n=1 Tax=Bauldia litoralis TaxID=665467 RepID=UPI0032674950